MAPGGASLPPLALLLAEPAQAGSVHGLQGGVWKGALRKSRLQLVQEELLQVLTSLGDLRVWLHGRRTETRRQTLVLQSN